MLFMIYIGTYNLYQIIYAPGLHRTCSGYISHIYNCNIDTIEKVRIKTRSSPFQVKLRKQQRIIFLKDSDIMAQFHMF